MKGQSRGECVKWQVRTARDLSTVALRCVLMSCLAAIALPVLLVISDGVLTAIPLVEAELCSWSLVPIGTIAIEITYVRILVFHLWIMRLRTTSAASLNAS